MKKNMEERNEAISVTGGVENGQIKSGCLNLKELEKKQKIEVKRRKVDVERDGSHLFYKC